MQISEKIKRTVSNYLSALREMPYIYQGAAAALLLYGIFTIFALIMTLIGTDYFTMVVPQKLLELERKIEARQELSRLILGISCGASMSIGVILATRRYIFMAMLKVIGISLIISILLQYVETHIEFFILSTTALYFLSWSFNSTLQTMRRVTIFAISSMILQIALVYIKMPLFPLIERNMTIHSVIFTIDLLLLYGSVVLIDYALWRKKEVTT